MMKLFNTPKPLPATERFEIPNDDFNYNSVSHLEIITSQIRSFDKSLNVLKTALRNMLIGLTLGISSWIGNYVFPTVTLSIIGFCIFTHYATLLPQYYQEYKKSLDDLMKAYQWSMGRETGNHYEKLGVDELRTLVLTLGPRASVETLCTWKEADLLSRDVIGKFLSPFRSNGVDRSDLTPCFIASLRGFAQGKHTNDWEYRFFGENAIESLSDMIKAAFSEQVKALTNNLGVSFTPQTIKLQ